MQLLSSLELYLTSIYIMKFRVAGGVDSTTSNLSETDGGPVISRTSGQTVNLQFYRLSVQWSETLCP